MLAEEKSRLDLIVLFSEAIITLRDPYENGHGRRVSVHAVKLAQAMMLDDNFIELLGYAARLHDIGKIGIDETTLNKIGKLNRSEMGMIKTHSEFGSNLVASLQFTKTIREIIYQHHENFNGTGYPVGLKGGNICVGARIIRIADCFDAMTNERPYRTVYSVEHAVNNMEAEVGTSFDPTIFSVFKKMMVP